MITVITGQPGSGKTLYVVDKLLRALVGTTIKYENDDGEMVEVPRTIYSSVNGLLLEHELIGADMLNTWQTWAKPGAVICYDEVQKPWPLIATGSKVPPQIEALETHRHMGVDFILMTQHPMMIHANVVRLAGRHLHMRRIGNSPLALTYEWDGVSRTLNYKNCMAKGSYFYSRKVFKLYKSAKAHTTQPRRIPPLTFVILAALGAVAYGVPAVHGRLAERLQWGEHGKEVADVSKTATKPRAPASAPTGSPVGVQGVARLDPRSPPGPFGPPAAPALAGCVRIAEQCRCLDRGGTLVPVEPAQCMSVTGFGRGPAINLGDDTPPPRLADAGDLEVHGFMKRQRTAVAAR